MQKMIYAEELKNALPDASHLIELSCSGVPVARIFRDIPSESVYCLKSYMGNAKLNMMFDEMWIEGNADIILMNKAFEVGSISNLDSLDMIVYERGEE